jgi:SAM-dependent methyltransferase
VDAVGYVSIFPYAVVSISTGIVLCMDQADRRDQSRDLWRAAGSNWASHAERSDAAMSSVVDRLIERANPQPGQTVLDVAAGSGGLGHRISNLVGQTGQVISTDFAPEMVESARRLGSSQGLENVDYRILDAEQMDMDDNSVDVVVSKSGYMLMSDPVAALRETRRVLRSAGRLAFSVFGTAEENPHLSTPIGVLVRLGHLPAQLAADGPPAFSMGEPSRIVELVEASSFDTPELDCLEFAFVYDDDKDLWNSILQTPHGAAVRRASEVERVEARDAVVKELARYRDGDGSYSLPAKVWVASVC